MLRLSLATDAYIDAVLSDEGDPPPHRPAPTQTHRPTPTVVKGAGSRSYCIDLDAMTIISISDRGARRDLTDHVGCPRCTTIAELRAFVAELCALGFYPSGVRDALLSDIT
jgi:hypothetical protein